MAAGSAVGRALAAGAVVFLMGELGAGKTTFTRGALRALGHAGSVKSPTYTLVEPYQIDIGYINHFDFFRIEHPDELDYIGLEEYFSVDTLSLIEWPDKGRGSLPNDDLTISVDFYNEKRLIQMNANSDLGEKVCSKVKRIA